MTVSDKLRRMGACAEAVLWAADYGADFSAAWAACPRGDWLLWVAARAGCERKLIVLAACDCARTVLKFVPAGEGRPLAAIETAEQWARAPLADAYDAHYAARAAAAARDDTDAADAAAYSSAAAAEAAAAATYVATDAAHAFAYAAAAVAADDAADAAAYADDAAHPAAAARAARKTSGLLCANLVRARITLADVLAAGDKMLKQFGGA